MAFSIKDTQHNKRGHFTEYCHAECRDLFIVMLNVIMLSVLMLSVVMLNVVMLSVVMLSVIMLNVVAPCMTATNALA
jgi:hypothetical protein